MGIQRPVGTACRPGPLQMSAKPTADTADTAVLLQPLSMSQVLLQGQGGGRQQFEHAGPGQVGLELPSLPKMPAVVMVRWARICPACHWPVHRRQPCPAPCPPPLLPLPSPLATSIASAPIGPPCLLLDRCLRSYPGGGLTTAWLWLSARTRGKSCRGQFIARCFHNRIALQLARYTVLLLPYMWLHAATTARTTYHCDKLFTADPAAVAAKTYSGVVQRRTVNIAAVPAMI